MSRDPSALDSGGSPGEAYTIWALDAPINKEGVPVMGNMGRDIKRVVVMEAETFSRLCKLPALANIQWRLGKYE